MSPKRAYRTVKKKRSNEKLISGKAEEAVKNHSFKVFIAGFTESGEKRCNAIKIDEEIKENRLKTRQDIKINFRPEDLVEITICGIAGNKTFMAEMPDGRKFLIANGEFSYSKPTIKK